MYVINLNSCCTNHAFCDEWVVHLCPLMVDCFLIVCLCVSKSHFCGILLLSDIVEMTDFWRCFCEVVTGVGQSPKTVFGVALGLPWLQNRREVYFRNCNLLFKICAVCRANREFLFSFLFFLVRLFGYQSCEVSDMILVMLTFTVLPIIIVCCPAPNASFVFVCNVGIILLD